MQEGMRIAGYPNAPIAHVHWPSATRLIESKYPPIDLFEDIADPADWELLARAEARTNPRVAETIGQLDKLPLERRVAGPGASYLIAPFVHCTPEKPGRFHDGHMGAYYAADSFETALAETVHHQAKRLSDSHEPPGWISDMRELVGVVQNDFCDITGDGFDAILSPDDYAASQAFANAVRESGGNGILYPSVRQAGGLCIAALWPNVVSIPRQARHIRYHWDGSRIDMIREMTLNGEGQTYRLEL